MAVHTALIARRGFSVAETARIRSGKRTIQAVHNNWCLSLMTGQRDACTCAGGPEYPLVATKARGR
jgi:hypothetical protein